MAKVTVMVLVYGVEQYIERCARSLFGQTMSDIEFIFVDDCSKDDSIGVLTRVLEEYPERKPYVRIIRHDENRGQAAGRNTAIDAVNTEYCIFCDSDDWVELDMYETLYKQAVQTDADVVLSDLYIEDRNKTTVGRSFADDVFIADDVLLNYHKSFFNISSFNKLVKTRIYRDNNIKAVEGANYGEDMLMMLMVLLSAGKVTYLRKPFYHYDKTRDTSISNSLHSESKLQSQIICNNELVKFAMSKDSDKYKIFIDFITLRNTVPLLYMGRFDEWRNQYGGSGEHIMKYTRYKLKYRFFFRCASLGFYMPLRIKNFIAHRKRVV